MKKKILFYQHVSHVGGSSWCLLELIKELDRARYEPVVVLRDDGPLATELERISVDVYFQKNMGIIAQEYRSKYPFFHFKFLMDLLDVSDAVKETTKLCKLIKPDIVYLNSAVFFMLSKGAKKAGIRHVVLHIREHWESGMFLCRNMLKNYVAKRYIDRLISISEVGADCFGFPEKTVVARDWPDFETRGNAQGDDGLIRESVPEYKSFFLVPGGSSPVKGTIYAIKAFRKIESDDLLLIILGVKDKSSSGWKSNLRELATVFGFTPEWLKIRRLARHDERVLLLPRTQYIKQFIEESIAVLCPFSVPHCAKAALEAGMLGKVAVLSENGEAREYVEHGKTGLIVSPRDVKKLREAMQYLLDNPVAVKKMGENACDFVNANFNRDKSIATIQKLLNGVPAGKSF